MVARSRRPGKAWSERLAVYRENHGGLSPYQVRKLKLAAAGTTPYRARKAAETRRQIGPQRREVYETLDAVASVRGNAIHESNIIASDNRDIPEYWQRRSDRNIAEYDEEYGLTHPNYAVAYYIARTTDDPVMRRDMRDYLYAKDYAEEFLGLDDGALDDYLTERYGEIMG